MFTVRGKSSATRFGYNFNILFHKVVNFLLTRSTQNLSLDHSSLSAWASHINGAITLVKMRGANNFRSQVSLNLFREIKGAMVRLPFNH